MIKSLVGVSEHVHLLERDIISLKSYMCDSVLLSSFISLYTLYSMKFGHFIPRCCLALRPMQTPLGELTALPQTP